MAVPSNLACQQSYKENIARLHYFILKYDIHLVVLCSILASVAFWDTSQVHIYNTSCLSMPVVLVLNLQMFYRPQLLQ